MHSLQLQSARIAAIGMALTCVIVQASPAQAKSCSPKDAEAADAVVDHIDSWTKLDWAFRKYGHCDDGSIAEGNSEAVARLLVDRWATLPTLAKLVKRNPALQAFVLRHIDTTLDTDDLVKIQELSASKCPANAALLCSALLAQAIRAAK